MAGLKSEQKADVEAMIIAALQRQTEDINGKVNAIIAQADAQCVALQNDMECSKRLHKVEMGALASAEARGNELIDRQNKMTIDCKALVESLEARFTETDVSTKTSSSARGLWLRTTRRAFRLRSSGSRKSCKSLLRFRPPRT